MKYRTKKQVVYCESCKVNLCIECYKVFHTVENLVDIKVDLNAKYVAAQKANEESAATWRQEYT